MVKLFNFLLFVYCHVSFAQDIERKIIIQNDLFYFTTIDPEFQVATLHTGNVSLPLSEARQFAIPGGRSLMDPVNPFVWDIQGENIFIINFIDNANNDKYQSLKKIPINSLKEKGNTDISGLVEESIYLPAFANNDPYLFCINRSPLLDNFYFDGISAGDSTYYLVMANNGELTLWQFNGIRWKQGKIHRLPLKGYFSLFQHNRNVYLLANAGGIFKISGESFSPAGKQSSSWSNSLLIINKDSHTVQVIKNTDYDSQLPLKKLIEKKATSLF
jgi:hypothetical protein